MDNCAQNDMQALSSSASRGDHESSRLCADMLEVSCFLVLTSVGPFIVFLPHLSYFISIVLLGR